MNDEESRKKIYIYLNIIIISISSGGLVGLSLRSNISYYKLL